MSDIQKLIARYGLISDQVDKQELETILTSLQRVLDAGIRGDIVEFGCYEGTTSLYLQRLIRDHPARALHVYDSFLGLPEKGLPDASPAGEAFKPGELKATKKSLVKHFRSASLPLPTIHPGWFDELAAEDIPPHIAFAFLDGDYYASIRDSLRLIEDRLSPGAIIVIDDYQSEALPGARKAVDKWLQQKDYACLATRSLAVISVT